MLAYSKDLINMGNVTGTMLNSGDTVMKVRI